VIVAKRKRVIAVQPPEIGVAAVLGFSKREHALILTPNAAVDSNAMDGRAVVDRRVHRAGPGLRFNVRHVTP
jgi:hypothetical protein